MTTISEVTPEMAGAAPEEIEISVEDHVDFTNAAKEEHDRSTNNLNENFFEADAWFQQPVDDGWLAKTGNIFVEHAIPGTPDEIQKTSKLPPTIALAATFDTEPTSSFSDDGSSTTSEDVNIQEIMSDFSCLSVLEVSTIMEEQEKDRNLSKIQEIQQEQEQIDQGLQLLHDDSTFQHSEMNEDTLELLGEEDDHSENIDYDSALDFGNNTGANIPETNLVVKTEDREKIEVPPSKEMTENEVELPDSKAISTTKSEQTASDANTEDSIDAPMDELQGRLYNNAKPKPKQSNTRGFFGYFKF